MSTLCESLRAKAVIVLLGIPLLSSSHAQELMGHSKFGTVLPQAVAARHLDPVAMFPTPPEVTYIDGLFTIGAQTHPWRLCSKRLPARQVPQSTSRPRLNWSGSGNIQPRRGMMICCQDC